MKMRTMLAALTTAAVIAAVGGGVVHQEQVHASPQAAATISNPAPSQQDDGYGQRGNGYGYGQFGNGSGQFGSNGDEFGQGDQSTPSSQTTDATASQVSGIVYINTVLGYGQGEAAGTGMILNSDGEVLTNNHVIDGATSISVQVVSTGKTYSAKVVGYDSTHDVAVLQLNNASGLHTVRTDAASTVKIGDSVVGVGNANGDAGAATASAGSVTALKQSITVQSESGGSAEKLNGLIETNADIIAGDSGGPLYDADGEVIGMDTAASSGTAQVSGYAIPIATALSIVDRIEQGDSGGTISVGYPAFLGVEFAQAAAFGASEQAATIGAVVEGSPAAGAGVSAGSTITSLGRATITSATSLSAAVAAHKPGDHVSVGWTDADGVSHNAQVTLAAGPAS